MKKYITIAAVVLCTVNGFAQQNKYAWDVGVYGGAMTYYGDLSSRLVDGQKQWIGIEQNLKELPNIISYGVSVGNNFSNSWGWRAMYSRGSFTANDRLIDWQGNSLGNNVRSLNVKTNIQDLSLAFIYYTDGSLFGENAFLAPYFGIGAGITDFKNYGDLYDKNKSRYYYQTDGSIRDAQGNNSTQDGDYETQLNTLGTESTTYNTRVFSIPGIVGLKFRISPRMSLNVEAKMNYTLTDYLDDVANKYRTSYDSEEQAYAANPNNQMQEWRGKQNDRLYDIYSFGSVSLHYNFGYKKSSFNAPYLLGAERVMDTAPVAVPEETETTTPEIETTEIKPLVIEPIRVIGAPNVLGTPSPILLNTPSPVVGNNSTSIIGQGTANSNSVTKTVVILSENGDTLRREYFMQNNNQLIKDVYVKEIIRQDDGLGTITPPTYNVPLVPIKAEEKVVVANEEAQELRLELAYMTRELARLDTKKDTLALAKVNAQLADIRTQLEYHNKVAATSPVTNSPTDAELRKTTKDLNTEYAELNTVVERLNKKETDAATSAELKEFFNRQNKNEEKIGSLEKEVNRLKKDKGTKLKKRDAKAYEEKMVALQREMDALRKQQAQAAANSTVVTPAPQPQYQQPIIIQQPAAPQYPAGPERDNSMRYDAETIRLQNELNALKNQQIVAAQNAEAQAQRERMALLERQLQEQQAKQTAADKAYIETLQKQMAEMQAALTNLKNQPAPVIVKETINTPPPAPVYIRETITVPAATEAMRGFETTSIFFASGSTTVTGNYIASLNKVADLMKSYSEMRVILNGFTDKSGNPQKNMELSRKRSEAVKNILLQRGISADRIETASFGVAPNAGTNDSANRKVDVQLITR